MTNLVPLNLSGPGGVNGRRKSSIGIMLSSSLFGRPANEAYEGKAMAGEAIPRARVTNLNKLTMILVSLCRGANTSTIF